MPTASGSDHVDAGRREQGPYYSKYPDCEWCGCDCGVGICNPCSYRIANDKLKAQLEATKAELAEAREWWAKRENKLKHQAEAANKEASGWAKQVITDMNDLKRLGRDFATDQRDACASSCPTCRGTKVTHHEYCPLCGDNTYDHECLNEVITSTCTQCAFVSATALVVADSPDFEFPQDRPALAKILRLSAMYKEIGTALDKE